MKTLIMLFIVYTAAAKDKCTPGEVTVINSTLYFCKEGSGFAPPSHTEMLTVLNLIKTDPGANLYLVPAIGADPQSLKTEQMIKNFAQNKKAVLMSPDEESAAAMRVLACIMTNVLTENKQPCVESDRGIPSTIDGSGSNKKSSAADQ